MAILITVILYLRLANYDLNSFTELDIINSCVSILSLEIVTFATISILSHWYFKMICMQLSTQPILFLMLFGYDYKLTVTSFFVGEFLLVFLILLLYFDDKNNRIKFYEYYQSNLKLIDWNILLESIIPIPILITKNVSNDSLLVNKQFKNEFKELQVFQQEDYSSISVKSFLQNFTVFHNYSDLIKVSQPHTQISNMEQALLSTSRDQNQQADSLVKIMEKTVFLQKDSPYKFYSRCQAQNSTLYYDITIVNVCCPCLYFFGKGRKEGNGEKSSTVQKCTQRIRRINHEPHYPRTLSLASVYPKKGVGH